MVYVFLADGFEEIEAITSIDVLKRAELDVQMISVTGSLTVQGAHGISVVCDRAFSSCDFKEAKAIVLPGGMPGADTLSKHKGLLELIKNLVGSSTYLAAICAAPMVFGKMGILENRKVVCYPGFEDQLTGAKIEDSLVAVDGQFVTGKGPGASMDFALTLVQLLKDKATAEQLTKDLCINA